MKKGVLRNFTKFIKKDSLVQVFSCEFCEISKNAFFIEHHRTTASARKKTDFWENRNCCLARSLPSPANIKINSSW